MKKIFLLSLIILAALVISGCCCCTTPDLSTLTGGLGTTVNPTTGTPKIPTPTGSIQGKTFAGSWDTDYGNMVLTVSGDKATGTYSDNEGMINGTVSGNKLTGTWTETPTRAPPDDAGDFVFTISDDGSSFQGLWRYGYSDDPGKKYDGFWYGTRIA